ncbi:THO complex subunit 3 [Pseudocercospora fuligena]|uniref:THO complex subunit 3 n=1 Tax=Pseudocercospora fuligena TaxID=685502 RepID=A0A8H6R8I6_9PEZI|nr:THO complex subunit 3 [Pseudocercospora fuligena]
MPPPPRPRALRKDAVALLFKTAKPALLSDSPTGSRTTLAPNIRSISWSPTGALIANTVSTNIRVWNPERPDVKASTELRDNPSKPGAHSKPVERISFNPRMEHLLASAGLDGMVRVWDVRAPGGATGLAGGGGLGARTNITGKSGEYDVGEQCLFLTWRPTGSELLVGTGKDKVTSFDLRKADTTMLDTTTTANTTASLKYDMNPSVLMERPHEKPYYYEMAFTNSGNHLLAATVDGSVKIFSYPSMKIIHTLSGHPSTTYSVQHSPAGNYVAVGGSDSAITLWDTSSWLCEHVLTENANAVRSLSFSMDGQYLVCGGGIDQDKIHEKGLHIWHVDTGELLHTVETINAPTFVEWHPLRYAVAFAGDPGGVKIVGGITGS